MKRILGCLILILLASTATIFAQDFGYTGSVQTFTASVDGWYKLEVWGSQGRAGAAGGYSVGYKKLSAGDTLYIACGGYGNNWWDAGWNGGSTGGNSETANSSSGGGGATHIALNSNRGVLSNYSSHRNEILIVAGGGGGGARWGSAGSGGGTTGGSASNHGGGTTGGGSQTGGYAFGQGQNGQACGGYAAYGSDGNGGGGGGWYGGYSSYGCGEHQTGGGSGGSGYIGGVTSWNGNNPSMSNGARWGYGKASVTLVQEDVKYYVDLNAVLNGTQYGNLNGAATANVYINGSLVNSNVSDFYTAYSNGTKFKMVITLNNGYGILSGSTTCEGTVNGGGTGCNFNLASKYTITVNPNNGTSTIRETRLWSQVYTLPSAPTKKGYTFVNWKRTN